RDVGCSYFKKLLLGAFFRLSINENSKGQDFYKIHDVIHSMIRLISSDICFCWEKNLRTLIMSSKSGDTTNVSFDFLSDMKHARGIDFSHMCIDNVPDSIYEMKRLRLLNNMNNVVTLRHLLFICFLENKPLEFGKLVNLETLSAFIVGKSNKNHGFQHLKDLDMLRGFICIVNLENVRSHDAKEASLHTELLTSENVFDGLCPHENLKELVIANYTGEKFLDWLNTLPKLSVINLIGCTKNSVLNDLGILHHLKSLVSEDMYMLDTVSSWFS
ncbi:hypothetical protein MIMGU_mgv1a019397mg, partial [Erythranthe guttata]